MELSDLIVDHLFLTCFSSVNNARFLIFYHRFNPTNKIYTKSEFSKNFQSEGVINWVKCFFYIYCNQKPSSASVFIISKISEITPPFLLINLLVTYAIWLEKTRKGDTFFSLVERNLIIIFIPVLSSNIGIQFLMNPCFCLFFNILVTACFWELLNSWFRNAL